MAKITVQQLAEVVGASVERLLKQMGEAGLHHCCPEDVVTDEHKQELLSYLKRSYASKQRSPRKITLKRKSLSSLKQGAPGKSKQVVVEVRRRYLNSDASVNASDGAEHEHRGPKDAELIKAFVAERGIKWLTHFTRVENLPGILEHGLLGRKHVQKLGISSEFNDQLRLDGQADAICLSISFPNYSLFYRFRTQEYPNSDWAVLRLKPSLLWEKQCMFYPWNAANSIMTAMTLEEKTGIEPLRRLFIDLDGYPTREATRVEDQYTTHPQAEVLVPERVGTEYIVDILFDQKSKIRDIEGLSRTVAPLQKEFRFAHSPAIFFPRSDYEHWK